MPVPASIAAREFSSLERLEKPLNDTLLGLALRLAVLEELPRVDVIGPYDVVIDSNTPTAAPWPLRLSVPSGRAPVGVFLLKSDNLTTPDVGGISTAIGQAACQWNYDGSTLLISFVSGLTLTSRYRLTFGVIYG